MSQFLANLNARRESLGLDIKEVTAELNRRGFDLAYSTVAGWFNGSRGERWKVDELRALLAVLETSFDEMAEGEATLVEGSAVKVELARRLRDLPDAQAQALLALLATREGK